MRSLPALGVCPLTRVRAFLLFARAGLLKSSWVCGRRRLPTGCAPHTPPGLERCHSSTDFRPDGKFPPERANRAHRRTPHPQREWPSPAGQRGRRSPLANGGRQTRRHAPPRFSALRSCPPIPSGPRPNGMSCFPPLRTGPSPCRRSPSNPVRCMSNSDLRPRPEADAAYFATVTPTAAAPKGSLPPGIAVERLAQAKCHAIRDTCLGVPPRKALSAVGRCRSLQPSC